MRAAHGLTVRSRPRAAVELLGANDWMSGVAAVSSSQNLRCWCCSALAASLTPTRTADPSAPSLQADNLASICALCKGAPSCKRAALSVRLSRLMTTGADLASSRCAVARGACSVLASARVRATRSGPTSRAIASPCAVVWLETSLFTSFTAVVAFCCAPDSGRVDSLERGRVKEERVRETWS